MKHERGMKKAGYAVLAGLLALVAFCYWAFHRIERGDAPRFLSDGSASVAGYICGLIFYLAVALIIFIILRSFYLGLTQSDSGDKHDHNA